MNDFHVWEKSASTRWEEEWRERLAGFDAARVVWHEKPGSPVFRMEVYCDTANEVQKLIEQFGGREGTARVVKRTARFDPKRDRLIRIGPDLILRILAGEPPASAPPENELWIEPARAFGTGEHATTRMCLQTLRRMANTLPPGQWRALDLGAGSGILALAARKLGAEKVEGVDYDPHATKAAKANARLNGIRGAQFRTAELGSFVPRLRTPVDLIAANLFSEVLCRHLSQMVDWLRPGGQLILSGILREQVAAVEERGRELGIEWQSRRTSGKWVALPGTKRAG